MAQSIYITSAEGHTGKSTIALGALDALMRVSPRVGVFRPIARSVTERDDILELMLAHDGVQLDYENCIGVTYDDVRRRSGGSAVDDRRAVQGGPRRSATPWVIIGSDYTDVASPAELGFNARIAATWGRRSCSCSAVVISSARRSSWARRPLAQPLPSDRSQSWRCPSSPPNGPNSSRSP